NPDGSLRWKFGEEGVRSTATFGSDGTICFGTLANRFVALNTDGTLKWEYGSGDGATTGTSVVSSAALDAGGNVFFGTLGALRADGTALWENFLGTETSSSPALAADGTIYVAH